MNAYRSRSHWRQRVVLFIAVTILIAGMAQPYKLNAARSFSISHGMVDDSTFENSFWIAMHAGPDNSGNTEINTAPKVFEKYFQTSQWHPENKPAFYGLGEGNGYTKTALSFATFYMAETTGPRYPGQPLTDIDGWHYTPSPQYVAMLNAAANAQPPRPIFVHFNGSRWMEPNEQPCDAAHTSLWCMFNHTMQNNLQFDQFNQAFTGTAANGLGKCVSGQCYLSIARGANPNSDTATYARLYKKRNLQEAVRYLLEWSNNNPGRLVAITLDSETAQAAVERQPFPRIGDYGPQATMQYRTEMQWQFNFNLTAYNQTFSSCQPAITNWEQLWPPVNADSLATMTNVNALNPCWRSWQNFRVHLVQQMVSDTARWATEVGMPKSRIYTHQAISDTFLDYMYDASPISTAKNSYSQVGLDFYEKQLFTTTSNGSLTAKDSLMQEAQDLAAGSAWGIPEFNAGLGPNAWGGSARQGAVLSKCQPQHDVEIYDRTYSSLYKAYLKGARVVMPYLWNPSDGTVIEQWGIGSCWPAMRAYRDFLRNLH